MKAKLRALHRWASLIMVGFWFIQAATGVLISFHRELDDASIQAPRHPLDVKAFGASIEAVSQHHPSKTVTAIWASGGALDRFDFVVGDARTSRTEFWRVGGRGDILRRRSADERLANGGALATLVEVHEKLLAGETGAWIVRVSGLLLLTNMLLAVTLAWPAPGRLRRALLPAARGPAAGRLQAWHRAIGLLWALPATVVVACGLLVAFDDDLRAFLNVSPPAPSSQMVTPQARHAAPGEALAIAMHRYPKASLAGMIMPTATTPWYQIRLRQPGEALRVYGSTTVLVGAADGHVLADIDALHAPTARRLVDLPYPIHTGEIGGVVGRLVATSVGIWLLAMITLGGASFWTRRSAAKAAAYRRRESAR